MAVGDILQWEIYCSVEIYCGVEKYFSGEQGVRKKKIGDTMLYFLVKDSRSPLSLPHLPKKAILGSIRAQHGPRRLCHMRHPACNPQTSYFTFLLAVYVFYHYLL